MLLSLTSDLSKPENKCEDVCETDCSDGGGAIADEAIGTGLTDSYGPPAVSRNNLNMLHFEMLYFKNIQTIF